METLLTAPRTRTHSQFQNTAVDTLRHWNTAIVRIGNMTIYGNRAVVLRVRDVQFWIMLENDGLMMMMMMMMLMVIIMVLVMNTTPSEHHQLVDGQTGNTRSVMIS